MSTQREPGNAVHKSAVAVVKETQSGTTSNATRATQVNEIGVGTEKLLFRNPSSWVTKSMKRSCVRLRNGSYRQESGLTGEHDMLCNCLRNKISWRPIFVNSTGSKNGNVLERYFNLHCTIQTQILFFLCKYAIIAS